MMSLFSTFDTYFFYFSFYVFIMVVYSLSSFYKLNSSSSSFMMLNLFCKFFYTLKPGMFNKFSLSIFLGSFLTILVFNFTSVFPFVFPLTSSFGMVLSFSLTLWGGMFFFQVLQNLKGLSYHCIPEGSPLGLSPFLFLIELVSMMIRPITLSVRLVANILAGHLLMSLLSSLVFTQNTVLPLYMMLNLIELLVAMIQSYIFCTMLVLYFSEVH